MTELPDLPDLPDLPRRTRPVPPNGLAQVMRAGRRRRALFLGTTGGAGVTAIALATVLLQPGTARDSLQFTDPPRTPTATPTATATERPTSLVVEGAQRPQAIRSPQPTAAEPSATENPAPEGSPAAAPPASRSSYTEMPTSEAAPATCQQPPSGHTGPIYYGSATACTGGSTGDTTVKRGGRVWATVSMCSPHGGRDVDLGYDGGREHQVLVYDGDGAVVYQFSSVFAFPQGPHHRTLGQGTCLVWTGSWDTTRTDGSQVPRGGYRVRVSVRADTVDGERTTPEEAGAVEFSVTVE